MNPPNVPSQHQQGVPNETQIQSAMPTPCMRVRTIGLHFLDRLKQLSLGTNCTEIEARIINLALNLQSQISLPLLTAVGEPLHRRSSSTGHRTETTVANA